MRLKGKVAIVMVLGLVLAVCGAVVVTHMRGNHADSEDEFLRHVEEARQRDWGPAEGPGLVAPDSVKGDRLEPAIAVDANDLEFGTIPNTGPTTIEVPIRNTGRAKLEIADIQSSCSCLEVDWSKDKRLIIAPDSETRVKMTMIPSMIPGFEATRRVTFKSNDPKLTLLEHPVHATIEPEFETVPSIENVDFGTVEKGTRPEMAFIVRQLGEEVIHVLGIETKRKTPELDISFEKRPQEQWGTPNRPECTVRIVLNTEAAPTGNYAGVFNLSTTCRRVPLLPCTVKAVVNSFFTVEPSEVSLKRIHRGNESGSVVVIKADRAIGVKDVTITATDMSATVEAGNTAEEAIVRVTVDANAAAGERDEQLSFVVASGDKAVRHRMPIHGSLSGAAQIG